MSITTIGGKKKWGTGKKVAVGGAVLLAGYLLTRPGAPLGGVADAGAAGDEAGGGLGGTTGFDALDGGGTEETVVTDPYQPYKVPTGACEPGYSRNANDGICYPVLDNTGGGGGGAGPSGANGTDGTDGTSGGLFTLENGTTGLFAASIIAPAAYKGYQYGNNIRKYGTSNKTTIAARDSNIAAEQKRLAGKGKAPLSSQQQAAMRKGQVASRPTVAQSAQARSNAAIGRAAEARAETARIQNERLRVARAGGLGRPPLTRGAKVASGAGKALVVLGAATAVYDTYRTGGGIDQGNEVGERLRNQGVGTKTAAVSAAAATGTGALGWSVIDARAYADEFQAAGVGKTQAEVAGTLKASPLYGLGQFVVQDAPKGIVQGWDSFWSGW